MTVGRTRLVGAAFLALLGGAIAAVLALSGHSLGRGVRFEVELAASGALKPGARIRIAGREIGEVLGMRSELRPAPPPVADGAGDGGEAAPAAGQPTQSVIVDCFALAEWTPHLHRNSEYFIATPTILGEAYLEIGPPLHHAEPGPPIADGERVRGVDPPQIDRLLQRVYSNLLQVMLILRAERPAIDELFGAGGALLADLRDTFRAAGLDDAALGRIRDAAVRTYDDALAIADTLEDAHAVPRVRALVKDLVETVRRVGPDVARIGAEADRVVARLDALSKLLPPERRERVQRGGELLAHALETARTVGRTVEELAAKVDRCEGTLGGFQCDKELYDDLHEVHRILKAQPWTLIVKPGKGQKTIVR